MKVYKHGDTRLITTFLILPTVINKEWHWFTLSTFKQRYYNDGIDQWWQNEEWIKIYK